MATTGFKIKSFDQVTASLVNWFVSAQSQITDVNVGSVARTLLEAVASELAEIYFRIFKSITEAQEEAVYRSFDFPRKAATSGVGVVLWQRTALPTNSINISIGSQAAVPATASQGEVVYSNNSLYVIPPKTTLASDVTTTGVLAFQLTSSANIGVGDVLKVDSEKVKVSSVVGNIVTVSRGYQGTSAATHLINADIGVVGKAVTMTAVIPGATGNAIAGAVNKINTPIAGIESVTNEASMVGGADLETDDERRKRFKDFITGLARGTKSAIEFGARLVNGVVSAKAIDLDDDTTLVPGQVKLFIADAAGTASSALLTAVDTEIVNWRPAGVRVTTSPPTVVPINVTATLFVDSVFNANDIKTIVNQRLFDFISAKTMGDNINLAYLYEIIVDTNPTAIVNAQITQPTGDVLISPAQLARPGTITLTTATPIP